MRKEKILKFLLIFFCSCATGVVPSIFTQNSDFLFIELGMAGILLLAGVYCALELRKIKTQKNLVETDEMFKKVGYTALAASFQLLMLIGFVLLGMDRFFFFLKNFSASEVLFLMCICGCALVLVTSRYYSHNPDKTGL